MILEADKYTLVTGGDTMSICIDRDKVKFTIVDKNGSTTIHFNIRELEFIMDIVPAMMKKII